MRVFVIGAGGCGSATFVMACRHIDNYTAGDQSLTESDIGAKRLDYPDGHIEADPRLVTALDALGAAFASTALFVHLRDEPDLAAATLPARRAGTVHDEIESFLAAVPYSMTIDLEAAMIQFTEFWYRIGADGDLNAAIAEFDRRDNAGRSGVVGRAR